MKQLSKLTRRQKEIVSANGFNPNDYMFVGESDQTIIIASKLNGEMKNCDKARRKRY